MVVARIAFALVWSPDGRLFAIGGADSCLKWTSTVQMLDCPWDSEDDAGPSWKLVAPMNVNRKSHGACFFEGKIFAAGGYEDASVECFSMPSVDLPKGQWTTVQPMTRKNSLAGLLPFCGSLLIVGALYTFFYTSIHFKPLAPVAFLKQNMQLLGLYFSNKTVISML